jgi:hypothetical protein
MTVWRVRDELGGLPAVGVLVVFYVLAAALALAVDDGTFEWASWIVVALLGMYCWARAADGWNVFLTAAAPNAAAAILHGAVGAPV